MIIERMQINCFASFACCFENEYFANVVDVTKVRNFSFDFRFCLFSIKH